MRERSVLKWAILLPVVFSLLSGCAGKGKDVKTIKGDPEVLYRQGLERFNKRDYSEALKIFEQIKSNFPDSPPYTLWAELKVGDCHYFQKDYVEAIVAYEEFKKTRPTHEDIPYVYYQIGMSYFQQLRTPDRDQTSTKKALSNFEYLVANTPPNIFTEKAPEKIGICKKHLADHEFYIGNFYYKKGKYQAAASRLEGLLEKFPKRAEEDKTLFLLGKSYLELDQWEKARGPFIRIVNEYPKSSHYREVKSTLDQGMKEKAALRKAKAKEPKKKADATERESERIALVKFDEEERQPVPFRAQPTPPVGKKEEKKVVSLPAETRSTPPTPPPIEKREEATPPLIKYEEEKRQPVASLSPSPKAEVKEEVKIEVKPEDEKRMAPLPPPPVSPETREMPKGKEGLKEEPQKKKEKEKVAALPFPSPREKGTSKKEIPAEPREVKLGDTTEPIDITSDRVEAFSKENRIVFKGNVMARQKDMVIYSDSLEAVMFGDGKGVERVVAGGNVKIQQGLRVANCQKAVFYNRDQKVILTGDPKVWEGENMVSGEEIIVDIEKNRVEVRGGPGGRGKVRVLPGGEFEKPK
ncbi:MAG: lipopolysaccharide transport periplasmic protein LptA [Deltaproteobacteria bacterium RBG_16_49_23]|nr:MAG: lipopolysaccharide transport periplasmic protein LptA [Deltaproteobacteria bacterium RBG_16_49_23]